MKKVLALHGFLGSSGDFDSLKKSFVEPELDFHALDLFQLWKQGIRTKEKVFKYIVENFSNSTLVGYSMGGRILGELFSRDPGFFKGLCLISSGDGLRSTNQEQMRGDFESHWLHKFSTEAPQKVLNDWNSLPIFDSDTGLVDAKTLKLDPVYLEFQLKVLGRQRQSPYFSKISRMPNVVFICGRFDLKYRAYTSDFRNSYVINGGHRLLKSGDIDKLRQILEKLL
ncbi:MAG: hypothetical protein AB8E15_05200 [Bdellovibrionales bacterium]